jgi:hypothetical protein
MPRPQQRAEAVVCYAETKSLITMLRKYRRGFGGDAPEAKTIRACFDNILAARFVFKGSGGTLRSIFQMKVVEIRTAFDRSPRKLVRQASRKLNIYTVYYNATRSPKAASFVCIQSADYPGTVAGRQTKAARLRYWHASSDQYGTRLPSKHVVLGQCYVPQVCRQNTRIWGSENPHIHREVVRDSVANVWSVLMEGKFLVPFFFCGSRSNGWLLPWYVGTSRAPAGREFEA